MAQNRKFIHLLAGDLGWSYTYTKKIMFELMHEVDVESNYCLLIETLLDRELGHYGITRP